jgi:hypothetical protein
LRALTGEKESEREVLGFGAGSGFGAHSR